MRRLRSKWGLRSLAAVMAVSLVPLAAAPALQIYRQVPLPAYADWLRFQCGNPPAEGFEEALEVALRSGARSLEAFLDVFLTALEERHGGDGIAHALAIPALTKAGLITYLQERFLQSLGDAMVPRTLLQRAEAIAGTVSTGGGAAAAVVQSRRGARRPALLMAVLEGGRLGPPLHFWMVSNERPQGP